MQWLIHLLGIDTQQSYEYDFWSGVGPVIFGQLPIAIGLFVNLKHRICHVKGCCWLGHPDPEHGWPACKKHHSKSEHLGDAQ